MKVYKEEEYLMLSGIQHFAFCRRQWALIHIENQWEENLRTVEGRIMHEKAHDGPTLESRKNVLISREMRIFSAELGITGICDVVEFRKCPANTEGAVSLFGNLRRSGLAVLPVGDEQLLVSDRLFLCASGGADFHGAHLCSAPQNTGHGVFDLRFVPARSWCGHLLHCV